MQMARKVDVEDLVDATLIAERFDVAAVTVRQWRTRYEDFPAPLADLSRGPVFSWRDVKRWADRNGLPDRRKQHD